MRKAILKPGSLNNQTVLNDYNEQIDSNFAEATAAAIENSKALKLNQVVPQIVTNGSPTFNEGIKLGLTPGNGTFEEGRIFYDQNYKTAAVMINRECTLQLGQEDVTLCHNDTEDTILAGQMVRLNLVYGDLPTILLAQADNMDNSVVLGMSTETILPGQNGLITSRGHVHDLDTHLFTPGAHLYLSPTIPGGITSVSPATDFVVQIGTTLIQSATVGTILISIIPLVRLTDILGVAVSEPAVDEILKYNGTEWTNGSASATSAGAGISFFLDNTHIIVSGIGPQSVTLESLVKVPVGGVEVIETVTVNNSMALLDQYLYNTQLGITSIDGGVWDFTSFCKVDDNTGITELIQTVNKVSVETGTITISGSGTTRTVTASGTPFIADHYNQDILLTGRIITANGIFPISGFTSNNTIEITTLSTYTNEVTVAFSIETYLFQASTGDINNTTVEGKSTQTTQSSFPILITDKLSLKYFAKTTHTSNVVVSLYHNGETNYSNVVTPLTTKHNDLPGLQGGSGTERYHLSLQKYNVVQNTTNINTGDQTISSLGAETTSNKTTSILVTSTDEEYPTAKATYDSLELRATQFPGIAMETPIIADDITIDYNTRVLTITPTAGHVDYFTVTDGAATKHTLNGVIDFPQFDDISGEWYFSFDSLGNIVVDQTPWADYNTTQSVYYIVWNQTLVGSAKSVIERLETHPNTISGSDHSWKHKHGAIWYSGFNITNNLTAGIPNANGSNTTLALSTGSNFDDSLYYQIENNIGGGLWQQDLGEVIQGSLNATNSAQMKILVQDSSQLLNYINATRFPFQYSAGNLPQYITSSGVRTSVTDTYYFVYYIYSSQDPRTGYGIRLVSAPTEFSNPTDAKTNSWWNIQTAYAELDDEETRPLYKLTFQYNSTYNIETKKTALREIQDLRQIETRQIGIQAELFSASAITNVPTGNITSTNVQNALNELDTLKLQSGLKAIGTEVDAAIEDTKYITALQLANSHNVPSVQPGTLGNFMTSDGTDWISSTIPLSGSNTGDETITTIKTKLGQATTGSDGYLTSTNWNTFNNKQATLTSGVNIRTVNSNSLLGSTNILVQEVLTSGSNIKTINTNSILGSGDFSLQPTLNGTGFIKATGTTISYDNSTYSTSTKQTGQELDTATDDVKFATALALKVSHNVPSVVPSTTGNLMVSNGTDWTSVPHYTLVAALQLDQPTQQNVTPISLIGLVFTYEANSTYVFRWIGGIVSASNNTGCGFQMLLSTTVTDINMTFYHQLANSGTLSGGSSTSSDTSLSTSSGIPNNNVVVPVSGQGLLRTNANTGTAQLRFRSEVNAVTTAKAGLTLIVEKIA